jgi:hypothetical protein
MAMTVLGVRVVLVSQHVPPFARLAILVLVGAVTFVPLCARFAGEVVSEVRELLQNRGSSTQVVPEVAPPIEA